MAERPLRIVGGLLAGGFLGAILGHIPALAFLVRLMLTGGSGYDVWGVVWLWALFGCAGAVLGAVLGLMFGLGLPLKGTAIAFGGALAGAVIGAAIHPEAAGGGTGLGAIVGLVYWLIARRRRGADRPAELDEQKAIHQPKPPRKLTKGGVLVAVVLCGLLLGCIRVLVQASDFTRPVSLAFSPDGSLFASSFTDGTLRVWQSQPDGALAEVALLRDLSGSLKVCLPANEQIVAVRGDGMVVRRPLAGDGVHTCFRLTTGNYGYPGCVFSSDAKWLVYANRPAGAMEVWDVESGSQLAEIEHDGHIEGMGISATSKRLAAILRQPAKSGHIEWRLNTWDLAATPPKLQVDTPVHTPAGAFSPDLQRAAFVGGSMINFEWISGPVVVWSVVSGEKETTIGSAGAHVAHLTFSSDGKKLLAKNYVGGRMRLLDVETGTIEAEEPGVPDTQQWLFSPDGKSLVMADYFSGGPFGSHAAIRLRDARTLQQTAVLWRNDVRRQAVLLTSGLIVVLTWGGVRHVRLHQKTLS